MRIRENLTIIPDSQTFRFLGAWVGNNIQYLTPWPKVLEKVSGNLARWNLDKPTLEGRRHIINMVIGGQTQYLTCVQGMPEEIKDTLIKMRDKFLWEGKRPRVVHKTMCLPLDDGGKQILDLHSRNEAIDLWNIKTFLRQGTDRANWPFFVDQIIIKRWEMGETLSKHGELYNIFRQNIHIPAWRIDPVLRDIKRMIAYNLRFTGLSISKEIKQQMPIWKHLAFSETGFHGIRRKPALRKTSSTNRARYFQDR
jgi:hypothetical protein